MIGFLQRVNEATVSVAGEPVATIGRGLLVLVGVQRSDGEAQAQRLLARLLHYRVFADKAQKMNRSLLDVNGGLLLVPQFTLVADTRKGMRPSFSRAAEPGRGRDLFEHLVAAARNAHHQVEAGVFGAAMQVALVNDGPVSFWLEAS